MTIMHKRVGPRIAAALFGLAALGACDSPFDVPDLNNPGLEQLEQDPTPTACWSPRRGS